MNNFRLLARILSVILLLLMGTIMVADLIVEGIPGDYVFSLTEKMLFIFLFASFIGMIIAWRNEGIGGALTVFGATLFMLINTLESGAFRFNPVFASILLTGILFLLSTRQNKESPAVEN